MKDTERAKSNIRIYWSVWFLLVVLFLTARFTIFRSSSENILFILFTIYAVPTWLAVMILNFYEGNRLMNYLKQKHRSKWDDITYVPFLGSGNVNSFRSLPFIYSKDDLGDPVVGELKKNYRRCAALFFMIFFTLPILFLTIMLFSK